MGKKAKQRRKMLNKAQFVIQKEISDQYSVNLGITFLGFPLKNVNKMYTWPDMEEIK